MHARALSSGLALPTLILHASLDLVLFTVLVHLIPSPLLQPVS